MKEIKIAIVLFFIVFSADAQNALVHFDKPFHVTGEVVWYDVKLPKSFASHDVAFNNYIADSKGNILMQYFTNNRGTSSFNGYFTVPYTWTSDMYQLVIATQDVENGREQNIYKFDFPIYNDIVAAPIEMAESNKNVSGLDQNISVGTTKSAYGPRDKVSININGVGLSDVSIAVIDNKLIADGTSIRRSELMTPVSPTNLANRPYLTGMVQSESGDPLKINVLGVYDSKANNMLYSKSGANGFFELNIEDFIGKKSLQINPYMFNEAKALEVIVKKETGTVADNMLTIDSTVISYMESSRARKKIYQQYGKVESLLEAEVPKIEAKELDANRRFTISDYQSFENVAAFFNEILASELSFTLTEDGRLKARMYNPKNKKNSNREQSSYFEKDPIFIIDNKITQDADKIGRLPLDNILTVDLYYKVDDIRRDFGTFGGSAYAIVTTSYPNFLLDDSEEEDIVGLHGYLPNVNKSEISNNIVSQGEPIFRSMIYYNPSVDLSKGSLSFNQSDDISDYQIIVIGQDNSGQPVMGQATYKVRY